MHKLTLACAMKSWDWKGKGFSVTLGMRLRNLRSSSCAVENKEGGCINVYKLCKNREGVGVLAREKNVNLTDLTLFCANLHICKCGVEQR